MDVPFRVGSSGVVDIRRLSDALAAHTETGADDGLDSAEYALQLIRFPWRQVFGEIEVPPIAAMFGPPSVCADGQCHLQAVRPDMFKHLLKRKVLTKAVFDERWAWLVRADSDLGSVTTWDPNLRRNKRILVPVDVQAYVAHASNPESLVPVTGGPGDPLPFAEGIVPESGVHLHWALPDALLKGAESASGGELEMTELPDHWVVIRSLFPVGFNRPMIRGWVVDAKKGSLTPLDQYQGVTNSNEDKPTYDRLDGTVGDHHCGPRLTVQVPGDSASTMPLETCLP